MIKLVNDTIDAQSIDNLVDWLKGNPRLTKGELTVQLEERWSEQIGVNHTVYVNSGSSAILLTLAALKWGGMLKNNKIVVPNLSWATDVSSPIILGMETHIVDCNFYDLSVDLKKLEELFYYERPSAFILVSVLGLLPRMECIVALCEKYDVILLEDACESMGSKIGDKFLGTYGKASFFSLYYGHHLSTIEGGFICTNDGDLYDLLVAMRSHGWDRDLREDTRQKWRSKHNFDEFSSLYKFYYPGFNVRATDLQAFIGLDQIGKLEDFSQKRNKNYKLYKELIHGNELTLVEREGDFVSNFAYPVVKKNRDEIVKELRENDIEVRPLIAGAMSTNPFVQSNAIFDNSDLVNSLYINQYGFYIPNHPELTEDDIKKVADIINKS